MLGGKWIARQYCGSGSGHFRRIRNFYYLFGIRLRPWELQWVKNSCEKSMVYQKHNGHAILLILFWVGGWGSRPMIDKLAGKLHKTRSGSCLSSTRVAEPKLFFSAPAPTFKKFRLWLPLRLRSRLRLEHWVCLFSQLLNEKVDFSWFFGKNIDFWSYSIWIMIKYTTLVCPGAGAGSQNFSIPAPAPAKSFGSGSATLSSTSGRVRIKLKIDRGRNILLHWS